MKLRKLKRFGRRPRRKSLDKATNHNKEANIENRSDDVLNVRVRRESKNSKQVEKTVEERSANWNYPSPTCANVPVQECRSVPQTSCQMVTILV